MRKRMLAYLKYIDQILSYDLDVTASFSDDGEFGERLVKDTVPTRKDYEKLLQYHMDHITKKNSQTISKHLRRNII